MLVRSLAALVALLVTVSTADAQSDHLQCFKVKDSLAKQPYLADLVPTDNAFPIAAGCTIKVPAKLLCIDVSKTNVSPAPPGSPAGAPAQKYLCYKVKCPKPQLTTALQDQFGTHSLILKSSSLVCAPEPAPASTTTTSSTTTTAPCANVDADGDLYFAAPCGNDCDDTNANVNPGEAETCNNVDDNCDGQTDEGLGSITCGTGQCQNTVPACVGGSPNTCTPNPAGTEVCDNVDNDCDGQTDEGLGSITCGTGQCQNTVPACVGGSPNTCTPGPAGTEICGTAVDEDCDGLVDEGGCVCTTHAQCPPAPNASGLCSGGNCTIACNAGYANCNGLNVDGCEVNIASDPNNCGSCGLTCPIANPNCVSGICQP